MSVLVVRFSSWSAFFLSRLLVYEIYCGLTQRAFTGEGRFLTPSMKTKSRTMSQSSVPNDSTPRTETDKINDPAIKRPGMPQWKWQCTVCIFTITSLFSGKSPPTAPTKDPNLARNGTSGTNMSSKAMMLATSPISSRDYMRSSATSNSCHGSASRTPWPASLSCHTRGRLPTAST